jgi:hypothetical protein
MFHDERIIVGNTLDALLLTVVPRIRMSKTTKPMTTMVRARILNMARVRPVAGTPVRRE